MHIHKIDKQKHTDFLKQNRQDPITGDLISAGDEVVFCHECKSAFLKDTWEYLGKSHCNQSRTLAIFPVKKTLNLKSKREFFKAYLHSISDWKQFDTQLKTLPWVLSSLDMKAYRLKNKSVSIMTKNVIGFAISVFFIVLIPLIIMHVGASFPFSLTFTIIASIVIGTKLLIAAAEKENVKGTKQGNHPALSIEKDQIIVFMPYKEQKVTLAKYKVEEIALISKEGNNQKLRVSYKGGTMFFSFQLNPRHFASLIETLYDWSDSVKIDLTKTKFSLGSMQNYSYLYASLDAEEEEPNLLLP